MMNEKLIQKIRIENYCVVDAQRRIKVDTSQIIDFFERIAEEMENIYIFDLNGFTEGTPHLDLLSEISDLIPLWVEANSRSVEDVSDILMAGAEKVVLDLDKLTLAELQKIADETSSIALIVNENSIQKAEENYNFLKRTGCEVILRVGNMKIFSGVFMDIPVILDLDISTKDPYIDMREKLNIVGRIVEMDLNDI